MDTFGEEFWSNCGVGNLASRTAPNVHEREVEKEKYRQNFIWQLQ
jgi:hypothetical protein